VGRTLLSAAVGVEFWLSTGLWRRDAPHATSRASRRLREKSAPIRELQSPRAWAAICRISQTFL